MTPPTSVKSLLHTISTCRAKANGYNFFHPPAFCDPPEHNELNVAYVTFKCKMPTCAYSTKHLITSAPLVHLYSHGFRCAQDKGKVVEHLSDTPAWEGMGKLEGREVLQQFALWCTCNGHPFGITDDDKLPRLLDEVARRHRPTPNGIEVLGVLAFFKTKAGSTELLEHVVPLEFIDLVNTHSGEYLARVVHELCNEYGILNKVMGIASDNACNMVRMMDELGEYGLGKDKWVRCWAHILNLVVTTIFAYFDSTTESRFTDPRTESEGEDPSVEDQHLSLNTRVVWFSNDDTAEDALIEKKRKATEWPGGQTKPAEPKGKDGVEDIYWEVHMRVESRGHREDEEEVDRWPTREKTSSDRYTRSSTKWTINKAQKLAEQCCYNRATVKKRWNSQTRQFCQIISHWAQIEKIQTNPKYNIKKENRLNRGDFRPLSHLLKVLEFPSTRTSCPRPHPLPLAAPFPSPSPSYAAHAPAPVVGPVPSLTKQWLVARLTRLKGPVNRRPEPVTGPVNGSRREPRSGPTGHHALSRAPPLPLPAVALCPRPPSPSSTTCPPPPPCPAVALCHYPPAPAVALCLPLPTPAPTATAIALRGPHGGILNPGWWADRGCPAHDRSARPTLEGFLNDPNTVPALHNAIILDLEKLFDYYGKTGDCPYYATAILLHPAGGTCYLKFQNWPQVWIDDAIEATQALYNTRHLDKARAARTKAQDHRTSLSTTTKSIFELLGKDDEDDIDLDLDNIVRNFATTKHAHMNAAGQPISALDYWKRQ
ncbi:hypothetical protein JCM1841_001030 [Sporobolomyces salmonicolor]